MATRIKRYEDRLEHMPDLLARIEREMGPDAQIERRMFRSGAFLGLLGGKRMVEVVATVEVSDDQLMGKPPKRRSSDRKSGNGQAAPDSAGAHLEAAASEAAAPAEPAPSAGRASTRIIPPPSELPSERIPSQRRQVDIRADEPFQVSMAGGGLELDSTPSTAPSQSKPSQPKAQPAKPDAPKTAPSRPAASEVKPAPVARETMPAAPKPAAKPAPAAPTLEQGALNQTLPPSHDPAPAMPARQSEPAMPKPQPAPAETAAPAQSQSDLADLRESINELKETVKLLVQAQARSARLEVQNFAAMKSAAVMPVPADPVAGHALTAAPEAAPGESLAQAAQQAQADEAQLLLELHGGADAAPGAESAVAAGAATPFARVVADPLALDPSAMLPAVQRQVFDRLLDWNIGPYDALELINNALSSTSAPDALSAADIIKVITGDICRNMLLSGGIKLGKTPPGRVVALVGATGVGKTTTIAKLAAKFAFQEGQRVSLVSLDNYRIAAAEQLRTYSEIMGIDLDIVFSKDEFDQQLTARRHSDLVLIDTAGRSPINTKQIYELREVFAAHPPDEVHLVVSASTKGDDLRAILENFTPLGYEHIIVSKLDETRSLGTIYNISKLCQHPISYLTVGQRVPEDIRTATLQFIQQWIEQGRVI